MVGAKTEEIQGLLEKVIVVASRWHGCIEFLIEQQSTFHELQLQHLKLEDLQPYNIVALRDDENLGAQQSE